MNIPHWSFSQHSTYSKCGRSWYLGKVVRALERPAWYTIVGTAVHNMIEDETSMEHPVRRPIRAEDYFYPLVSKLMLIEPDTGQWMFSKDGEGNPITKERALRHVQECFERAVEYLQDIDVWEVEYDASGRLPGFEVELKAFIDIIGEHKKHGPVIVDWKTGKTKDRFQLDTYAALLKGGEFYSHPYKGYFAMLAPWAPQSRYLDLSAVDPAEVGKKYQDTYSAARAGFYKATNVTQVCDFCFHKLNCLARSPGTERAIYYDRSEIDGLPF